LKLHRQPGGGTKYPGKLRVGLVKKNFLENTGGPKVGAPNQQGAFAPVIMTVYDRSDHLRQTLSSLAQNFGANETTVYVASDGPRDDGAKRAVEEVRAILSETNSFKELIVWNPPENTAGNIANDLLSFVRNRHESYIFSEDDNAFSPHFLRFINDGLQAFAREESVRAICGYLYPGIKFDTSHQVYLKCFTPWGFGTWSNRSFDGDDQKISVRMLSDRRLFQEINQHLPHLVRLNRRVALGQLSAQDARISNEMIIRNQVCVFPPMSLVRNIGNDGSGLNSKRDLRFSHQPSLNSAVTVDWTKPIAVRGGDSAAIARFLGGPIIRIANRVIHWEFRISHTRLGRFLRMLISSLMPLGKATLHIRTVARNFILDLVRKTNSYRDSDRISGTAD
jgi:hypothetical protein